MFGIKRLVDKVDKMQVTLDRILNLVNADERLASQNKDLMDRFMSTDFETYVLSRETSQVENVFAPVIDPLADESSAGEILSDEEIGQ